LLTGAFGSRTTNVVPPPEPLADVIHFTLADAADAQKPHEPCDFWRLLDDLHAAPHTGCSDRAPDRRGDRCD